MDSPFTLLTLIAAPAVLTNASCLLVLNTANRYGRAFDRTKEIGLELERSPQQDDLLAFRLSVLQRLFRRAMLLLRAQTAFYVATGLFVLSALVALLGAALSLDHPDLVRVFAVLGLAIGALATLCLVQGCIFTVQETRLAMSSLREEGALLLERHAPALHRPGSSQATRALSRV